MTYPRSTALALVQTALLVVPLSSASAHRYHGGPFFWPFAAAAAVVGAAVAVASAPFAVIAAPPAYTLPAASALRPRQLIMRRRATMRARVLLRALIEAGGILLLKRLHMAREGDRVWPGSHRRIMA